MPDVTLFAGITSALFGMFAVILEIKGSGFLIDFLKHLAPSKSHSNSEYSSPKAARFLLLMLPKSAREHLVGDLEEEFSNVVLPEYGPRAARCWYWWQAICSILPMLWAGVKRVCGLVFLWKNIR